MADNNKKPADPKTTADAAANASRQAKEPTTVVVPTAANTDQASLVERLARTGSDPRPYGKAVVAAVKKAKAATDDEG